MVAGAGVTGSVNVWEVVSCPTLATTKITFVPTLRGRLENMSKIEAKPIPAGISQAEQDIMTLVEQRLAVVLPAACLESSRHELFAAI
jgi:hypothetical protein